MSPDTEIAVAQPAKRKRKSTPSSTDLKGIGASLGLVFTPEDLFYLMVTGPEVLQSRASLARKASLYASLLKRVVPDTELTRRRTARLLEGLEALSKALRVLLTLDDLDLIGEVKTILIDALEEFAESGGDWDDENSKAEFEKIVGKLKVLSDRLTEHPDPRVQNALIVLSKANQLLDVMEDFPKLPSLDDVDLRAFQPTPRLKSGRH
jgi:hypothetical protein